MMRHAKSDWFAGVLDDHGRPLNARGRADAPRIGQWIADAGFLPDRVFCSDAQRTRETLALVMNASGWQDHAPELAYSHQLYMAGRDGVLQIINACSGHGQKIMVLGHNPTMDGIVRHFCPESRPAASGKLMTTAAVAVIDTARPEGSRLLHLMRPGDLQVVAGP